VLTSAVDVTTGRTTAVGAPAEATPPVAMTATIVTATTADLANPYMTSPRVWS
jgi:hypothetical protein